MKLTPKKTLYIILAEIALAALVIGLCLLVRYLDLWELGKYYTKPVIKSVRNALRYDQMNILAHSRHYAMYFRSQTVQNPDGTFLIFSHKTDIESEKSYMSIIKLDSKFKQVWEKLIPAKTDLIPSDISFDGKNYHLVSTDYRDSTDIFNIWSFDLEGKLLSEVKVKTPVTGDWMGDICYKLAGNIVYIFNNAPEQKRQRLIEADIDSGKVLREYSVPIYAKTLKVSHAVIDPKDKSVYFAGTDRARTVFVWKLDVAGKFSQIISQKFTNYTTAALGEDDKPYLITSTWVKSGGQFSILTAFGISDNGLDKIWSYQVTGKGQERLKCLKTADNWYVSDLYLKGKEYKLQGVYNGNPDDDPNQKGSEYFSAVVKLDNTGKYISQSKYAGQKSSWLFQLSKSRDGRIIYSGTAMTYYATRPFVAVVK